MMHIRQYSTSLAEADAEDEMLVQTAQTPSYLRRGTEKFSDEDDDKE